MRPEFILQVVTFIVLWLFWQSVIVLLLSPIPRLLNNGERSVRLAFLGFLGVGLSPIMTALMLKVAFNPPARQLIPFAFDLLIHGPAILFNKVGFRSVEYEALYMPITITVIVASLVLGVVALRQR